MATYRHSGAMPPLGILLIVGSGAVTACVLGVVYSFANYYIPFIYFHFFFALGLGGAIGGAVVWAARTGKVRNMHLLGIYGAAFGLLGLYAAWGADPLARFGIEKFGFRAFHPSFMTHYMKVFYHQGFWTLGHAGQKGGDLVSGVFLGAIWLAEAGVIVGIATWIAWRGISSQPFCETCKRWTVTEANVQWLAPFSGQAQSLEQVKAGELAALDDFDRAPANARAYLQLDLARCPKCRQSNFLSIYNCQRTVDKNGKPKVNKIAVVENLIIAADDVPAVRTAGRAAPDEDMPPADSPQSPPEGGAQAGAD
jgi:hypothetical protein